MNKSILVIDTPKYCYCCKFYKVLHQMCSVNHDYINVEDVHLKKPNSCPLRPLPKKKPTKDTDKNVIYGKNADAINRGWNACLDEITGEKE